MLDAGSTRKELEEVDVGGARLIGVDEVCTSLVASGGAAMRMAMRLSAKSTCRVSSEIYGANTWRQGKRRSSRMLRRLMIAQMMCVAMALRQGGGWLHSGDGCW